MLIIIQFEIRVIVITSILIKLEIHSLCPIRMVCNDLGEQSINIAKYFFIKQFLDQFINDSVAIGLGCSEEFWNNLIWDLTTVSGWLDLFLALVLFFGFFIISVFNDVFYCHLLLVYVALQIKADLLILPVDGATTWNIAMATLDVVWRLVACVVWGNSW